MISRFNEGLGGGRFWTGTVWYASRPEWRSSCSCVPFEIAAYLESSVQRAAEIDTAAKKVFALHIGELFLIMRQVLLGPKVNNDMRRTVLKIVQVSFNLWRLLFLKLMTRVMVGRYQEFGVKYCIYLQIGSHGLNRQWDRDGKSQAGSAGEVYSMFHKSIRDLEAWPCIANPHIRDKSMSTDIGNIKVFSWQMQWRSYLFLR
jgi:hypothetical protein